MAAKQRVRQTRLGLALSRSGDKSFATFSGTHGWMCGRGTLLSRCMKWRRNARQHHISAFIAAPTPTPTSTSTPRLPRTRNLSLPHSDSDSDSDCASQPARVIARGLQVSRLALFVILLSWNRLSPVTQARSSLEQGYG
jgi:hypothetical protein